MYIRVLSDLHTEFYPYSVTELPNDSETILILAGDCGLYKHKAYVKFIQSLKSRFPKILHVAGNHEWYKGKFPRDQEKFIDEVGADNFIVLQNSSIDIDGVLFLGATFWTSARNGNPVMMFDMERRMNDYRYIRVSDHGYRKLKATDTLAEHYKSKDYIFNTLEKEKSSYEKIVVITHHLPTYQSVSEEYKGQDENCFFASEYEHLIVEHSPTVWIHGHTHRFQDYMIEDTRIICNPRGYVHCRHDKMYEAEDTGWNEDLLLTI